MRKKFLAVVLSLTMAVSMMAGCGSSQEDYEDDIKAFEDIADIDVDSLDDAEDKDDVKDIIKDLKKEIKALKFSTKEGKAVRDGLADYIDVMGQFYSDMLEIDEDDYEKYLDLIDEYEDKMEDCQEKVEDAIEEFIDAAEDAGVDEDDLEDLGF